MTTRIAINGFGRIGRMIARALIESRRSDISLAAVNDLGAPEHMAHLLRFDSAHGRFPADIRVEKDSLRIADADIRLLSQADPSRLPWKKMEIDIALECTGRFTAAAKAAAHLEAGARRVLISAPAGDADKTIVYGVNHEELDAAHRIVSNASCTTNCLAPLACVLEEFCGIVHGHMTTIHAYTGDQSLVDTPHSDPRRARAGAVSMIPTTTGAARAVALVLPDLAGRLDGAAVRVPTLNVSLADFTFRAEREVQVAEINEAIRAAAASERWRDILEASDLPLVSVDFNHNSHSSICDLAQTQILNRRLVRVVSWYDNEWGFANRMLDVAARMGALP